MWYSQSGPLTPLRAAPWRAAPWRAAPWRAAPWRTASCATLPPQTPGVPVAALQEPAPPAAGAPAGLQPRAVCGPPGKDPAPPLRPRGSWMVHVAMATGSPSTIVFWFNGLGRFVQTPGLIYISTICKWYTYLWYVNHRIYVDLSPSSGVGELWNQLEIQRDHAIPLSSVVFLDLLCLLLTLPHSQNSEGGSSRG